jgi:hypothetical protein
MKILSRIVLAALLAAIGMSAASSSALAISGVSISPGGAITASATALISRGTVGTLSCNVSLVGTLRAGLTAAGGSIGSITSGRTSNCTLNGSPTTVSLTFNPAWNITIGANGLITVSNVVFVAGACTYRGSVIAGYTRGPPAQLITLASTLTGSPNPPCGTSTIQASQTFNISPAQTITTLP